jgi:hypothetical protein
MMTGASLTFAPLLPWPLLAALTLAVALVAGLGFWRRARGMIWRALMLLLGVVALANPVIVREQRQPLNDVVVLLVDRSPSTAIGERPAQLDEALAALRASIGDHDGLELVETVVASDGERGTRLFEALGDTLAEIDRSRLGGVLVLSDGQVDDVPESLARQGVEAPVHLLLTGQRDERDRRLLVERVPNYGMVGDQHEITFRIDDLPTGDGAPVAVTLRQDGEIVQRLTLPSGVPQVVPFELDRAGRTVLELEAEAAAGEVTALNNRQVFFVNGVRDRLRVLLVSGQPYPGLRVWRNLLKADPAVDLVHFTILRPPEKQDGTPIRELALIAFPSRELFEVKLDEFDLVIFDRYSRRGLLPLAYLDNVARYVEDGGALLEVAGPEFAHPLSLYRTPLARVLPARPSGVVYERGFTPELTTLGERHPVTHGLRRPPGMAGEEEPGPWGRWFRQVDVEVNGSQVLMTGAAERPVLVLERIGEGRVAQLLSDHVWLWARGFEGGGPQGLLLRRLVHWLMQEPELEEEALRAEPDGEAITIERRSLEPLPEEVQVTSPAGATSRVAIEPAGEGLGRAVIETDEAGLFRITDDDLTTYVAVRPIGALELADMRATPERFEPLVEASGGAITWLVDGTPSVRHVVPGRALAGRDWIGIHRNERYLVTGASQLPLLPAILALALLLATLGAAWYREGH